jgi:hypothetical protein
VKTNPDDRVTIVITQTEARVLRFAIAYAMQVVSRKKRFVTHLCILDLPTQRRALARLRRKLEAP